MADTPEVNTEFDDAFNSPSDAPPEDPPGQDEPEAAPSTEGVVTSEKPEEAPEAPKRNLGRLSTDELLAMVASGDPDAPRAIELRLRRNENQPKRQNRELEELERKGAAVKNGIKGLHDDFPEIAARLAPINDFVEATTAPLREAERQLANDESMAKIERSFPGFVPVARSSEFMNWLQNQQQDVKHDFQHGGNDGAINVLDAFDTHVRAQGKPSPFAPLAASAPAYAAPDKAAKAAQIVERRAQTLRNSASVPTGARNASAMLTEQSEYDAGFAGKLKI